MMSGISSTSPKLRLKIFDDICGPGSPLTEQIPSGSPGLSSPLHSGNADSALWHPDDATLALASDYADGGYPGTINSPGDQINFLHIVIVGGDIAALAMALALANVEGNNVTLVNAGFDVGEFADGGPHGERRGLQLCSRTVALLDGLDAFYHGGHLGGEMEVAGGWESMIPDFNESPLAKRWKGKGKSRSSACIGQRLRESGVRVDGFSIRRCERSGSLYPIDVLILIEFPRRRRGHFDEPAL